MGLRVWRLDFGDSDLESKSSRLLEILVETDEPFDWIPVRTSENAP